MEHTSEFDTKVKKACQKKEALFTESKGRYAVRSMFAGAFLTMSTAAGALAAQNIASINPALSKFIFAFIFTWGLVYILFLNAELATSNMMYLTAGVFQKHIKCSKALTLLLYCGVFNLIGAMIVGAVFAHTSAFSGLEAGQFIAKVVEGKLARGNESVLLEAIVANVFVNVAILSFLLIKSDVAKMWIIISAIFMFVYLGNEHVVANFASFSIVKFTSVGSSLDFMNWFNMIRHWLVAFVGNWIGGGIIIGLAYAYLNRSKTVYVD